MLSQQFSVGVCKANDFLTNQIADRHCFALALEGLLFFKNFGKSGKIGAEKNTGLMGIVFCMETYGGKFQKRQECQVHHIFFIWHLWPHLPNFCQSNAK